MTALKLAAIFSDNMVLQRDYAVRVFGDTDKEEVISISIDDIQISEKINPGKWEVVLPAHKAGGPFDMTISTIDDNKKAEAITMIKNILYGEVWINNGQSNIEFELKDARGGAEEIKNADYPDIRYFKCIKAPVIDDAFLEEESKLSWKSVTNEQFSDISAIGYYYATLIHDTLGVPVGLIDCYLGGTSISCWMEMDTMKQLPEAKDYLDEYNKIIKDQTAEDYENTVKEYYKRVEVFLEKEAAALKADPDISPDELGKITGIYPWPPPLGRTSEYRPGGLIETMFKRIAPFTVRGLVYYQGEEDAHRNYEKCMKTGENSQYAKLLIKLISEYRRLLKNPDMPVCILQLTMFLEKNCEDNRDWAYLREAQELAVVETNNAHLVSLIDCGEYGNVHPLDKKLPGERTAKVMLDKVYGTAGIESGDAYLTWIRYRDNRLVIKMHNTYGGLKLGENELTDYRGEITDNSLEHSSEEQQNHIYGLEVSLDGETWYIPDAHIEGDTIVIKDDRSIDEVRYGFFNYGKVNVYNNAGIPLRPFRAKVNSNNLI